MKIRKKEYNERREIELILIRDPSHFIRNYKDINIITYDHPQVCIIIQILTLYISKQSN